MQKKLDNSEAGFLKGQLELHQSIVENHIVDPKAFAGLLSADILTSVVGNGIVSRFGLNMEDLRRAQAGSKLSPEKLKQLKNAGIKVDKSRVSFDSLE
jgi:hypothetical protein